MKTLGIIGGLGPESTLDYYQRIIALYRERTGNRHYPEFVVVSVDLTKGLDFMDANDLSGMGHFLLEGINKLAREGIELLVPDPHDRDYIHDKYMNELVAGKFLAQTRVGLLAIVDRMKTRNDIDGVIL